MGIAQVEEVVVGAGVGGMTAALLLARAGAPVSLLERAATPGDVGAWILLQPNGLAVPTGLGLVGELERAGQRMTVSAVRGSGHAPIATLATPDFGHGLDHVFAVQRSLFHEVLLQAVADNPVIDCRLAASVTGVSTDGSADLYRLGRHSTIRADLVVGADEIHSTVRAEGSLGARQRSTGPGTCGVWSLSPTSASPDRTWHEWSGSARSSGRSPPSA